MSVAINTAHRPSSSSHTARERPKNILFKNSTKRKCSRVERSAGDALEDDRKGPGLLSTGCFGLLLTCFICLILKIFMRELASLGVGVGGVGMGDSVYGSQFRVRNTLGMGGGLV